MTHNVQNVFSRQITVIYSQRALMKSLSVIPFSLRVQKSTFSASGGMLSGPDQMAADRPTQTDNCRAVVVLWT